MELFDKNGCLTDEGLQALQAGGLDELGRLETAEHLSYCDKCMDRYTAQPEILGKPMDDDKPKQQASLAKALNDLLFGAGGPAAEKHKNSPLADQTK